MGSLFPIAVEADDIPLIPGLSYCREYVSRAEEALLAAAIDAQPWDMTWERRRQPYGASYGSKERDSNGASLQPIPAWGMALAERMHAAGISPRVFDQMLVNEYLPGQGIALHRDYRQFDRTVVSLSLLAPCVMDFRQPESHQSASLLLEPRSLLILTDEARYDWQHGIARRKNDRWQGLLVPRGRRLSVTFRLLKREG